MTGFEITLQGHWFKIFGRAFLLFSQLGWSIGSLLVQLFRQNTLLRTHRRSIFRPTLWKLKLRPQFPKMKILIFSLFWGVLVKFLYSLESSVRRRSDGDRIFGKNCHFSHFLTKLGFWPRPKNLKYVVKIFSQKVA